MQVELNEQECGLILRLLDVQVTLPPSQMQQYVALVSGIAEKLKNKPQEAPIPEPQPPESV